MTSPDDLTACWLNANGWGEAEYMSIPDEAAQECRKLRGDAHCPVHSDEYTYHAPLIEDTALEFVIGINDADIFGSWMPNENPEGEETLWEALRRLEADPDTWKLDIEVRDECGCLMVVIPLLEREAP